MSGEEKFVRDARTRLFDWRTAIIESDLPPTTKLVALVLSLHMNRAGESCFPGLPLLQRQTSLSRSTVQDHVRALAGAQWLERRQRPGRGHATEYVATFPPHLVDEIIEKAREAGLSQKRPEKARETPEKGPPSRTPLSIEDVRTRGREDVETSATNVAGAMPRAANSAAGHDDFTDSQLMGLVRTHLYVPDGKPPAGEDGGRDVTVIRALRGRGYSGLDIAAAIEGLALLRDRGDFWVPAGTKVTMRALFNTRSGVRPAFMLAQETYHKHRAGRRVDGQMGMAAIADVLRQVMA